MIKSCCTIPISRSIDLFMYTYLAMNLSYNFEPCRCKLHNPTYSKEAFFN